MPAQGEPLRRRCGEQFNAKMQADAAQTRVPPIPATFTPPLMDPPGPVHTTISKLGRGLAASAMTAIVLFGLFLTAVPIYLTLLRATLPKVTDVKEPLFFDYRLPQPAATMPLLPPELRSKAYAYAAEDKPVKKFPRVFIPGQLYDVTVRLELPDSEQNVQVGIFQVRDAGDERVWRSGALRKSEYMLVPVLGLNNAVVNVGVQFFEEIQGGSA